MMRSKMTRTPATPQRALDQHDIENMRDAGMTEQDIALIAHRRQRPLGTPQHLKVRTGNRPVRGSHRNRGISTRTSRIAAARAPR